MCLMLSGTVLVNDDDDDDELCSFDDVCTQYSLVVISCKQHWMPIDKSRTEHIISFYACWEYLETHSY